MERALLIVNPAARGAGLGEPEAVAVLTGAGVAIQVVRTTGPGDAARLAAAGLGEGCPILVLGGDGTVMEVVGATVGSGIPVGVLPGGTGNQLARNLGIPLDIAAAARRLVAATPVRYDLGRLAGGRYFALAAGLGIDAAIMAGATPAAKHRFGLGAYVWSSLRAIARARPFPVRIDVDGRVCEREAELALIANVGSLMNGRLSLGPGARPDDGWLDVCIVSPTGLVDRIALAARMARGDFRDTARIFLAQGRRIAIEAPSTIGAEADGELLATSRLDAEIVPLAATFLA